MFHMLQVCEQYFASYNIWHIIQISSITKRKTSNFPSAYKKFLQENHKVFY